MLVSLRFFTKKQIKQNKKDKLTFTGETFPFATALLLVADFLNVFFSTPLNFSSIFLLFAIIMT